MEGPAYFAFAIIQYRQLKESSQIKTTYQHNTSANPTYILKTKETTTTYREYPNRPHLPLSITSKLKTLKSKLTEVACKMPSGLLILHVPSNPQESPQFVRLGRKGIGRKVIFLHPNGEYYKVPQYTDLKGHERDCGPQTAPVFGGAKRTCEGGCCGWFTTDVGNLDKLEIYDFLHFETRPKSDIFLVRHGVDDGETKANRFMQEGIDHLKEDGKKGRGHCSYLGDARLYK